MPLATIVRSFVLACLASSFASTAQANLVANAGFESGSISPSFQFIDYGGATNWTISNSDAHTGTYSATAQGNKLIVQYFTPTPVSSITNVSLWLKNPQGFNSAVYLEYSDLSSGGVLVGATHAWQYVDMTSFLTPGKSLKGIGVWGYSQGGTDERTYTDDWQVVVTPEPTALGLAGTAMLLRRRRAH